MNPVPVANTMPPWFILAKQIRLHFGTPTTRALGVFQWSKVYGLKYAQTIGPFLITSWRIDKRSNFWPCLVNCLATSYYLIRYFLNSLRSASQVLLSKNRFAKILQGAWSCFSFYPIKAQITLASLWITIHIANEKIITIESERGGSGLYDQWLSLFMFTP